MSNSQQQLTRPQWSKKIEFILACVGYAVGLGNVWRFPYLCYSSGGGAFLIPFFITLLFCAFPLMYMELAVGAGVATVVMTFWLVTYYVVILAWALYYLIYSFQKDVPWKGCKNPWNKNTCYDSYDSQLSNNTLKMNGTLSPGDEYYRYKVLQMSSTINDIGSMRYELVAYAAILWIIVYFCIWKGVKSAGKVVYVTATFPYIVLLILVIRGCTLPGAKQGLIYFFKPKWGDLLKAKVWLKAAQQNFNSVGIAFGSLIAMSSYNNFNNNIIRDVLPVVILDAFTSIIAGTAIFSVLGYIAHTQKTDIDNVVLQVLLYKIQNRKGYIEVLLGPGLVFSVYPEAIATMKVAPLWAILFFLMLLFLGIDSQFTMVEVVVTTIEDEFHVHFRKYFKRKEYLVIAVCLITFLLGLVYFTQAGIYFFTLVDHFAAGVSLMYIAFFEVIAIVWFYGAKRLANNVEEMTGKQPHIFFVICWYAVAPALILAIWIFSFTDLKRIRFGKDYVFPVWAETVGWCIALLSIIAIPLGAMHAIYKADGNTLWQVNIADGKKKMNDILVNIDNLFHTSYELIRSCVKQSEAAEKRRLRP
ncbi:unnamed protein product [Didymodactylos carnosus]|uniref:Transporter n=1 Tax=Didymodactylos carnosus TaxID=1234261 RepID=A0A814X6K0_9BILA|nr:unnamed protein product [Didymodactylos carnosus]CAF3975947.1 unnamed protein product [Didymodactylos carnosus]